MAIVGGGRVVSGFMFDGRWVDAAEGGSVGGALWADGERSFRRTRVAGAPRALFCGIGNCFDCLVDLPGRPTTRACITPVEVGVEIHRSHSLGAAGLGNQATTGRLGRVTVDVAVVGAGPAGLAAAVAAGELGVSVALVDAAPAAGGNIWRAGRGDRRSGGPPRRYRRLPATVTVLSGTSVIVAESRAGGAGGGGGGSDGPGGGWAGAGGGGGDGPGGGWAGGGGGGDGPGGGGGGDRPGGGWAGAGGGGGVRLHLDGHPGVGVLDAATVVLATGATEIVHPFPGWDLPGVITAGAAQALLKGDGVVAGQRVLVAGTGPLLLAVAADLAQAGAHVILAEGARPRHQLGALSGAAVRHPTKVVQAVGLTARLARHRVRVLTGRRLAAVRAVPEGSLLMARLAPERWLAVDAVCVHHGLAPDVALVRALGCTTTTDTDTGEVAVQVDDRQATDRPGVFAAGEVTGIAGAPAAEAEGRVAGLAAALHAREHGPRTTVTEPSPPGGTGPAEPDSVRAGSGAIRPAEPDVVRAGSGAVRPVQPDSVRAGSGARQPGSADVGWHRSPARARRRLGKAQRRASRERGFGEVLSRLWPAPGRWWEHVEPGTNVCRCEEVTWSAVADAVAEGAHDLRAVKGRTRAGMGLCQGRVCGPPLQLAVAALAGRAPDEVADLASRPIAAPVTLARLAELTPADGELPVRTTP